MSAKGINITEYRGAKVRRLKKAVLHLTDDKGRKLHVRFNWQQFTEMLNDFNTSCIDCTSKEDVRYLVLGY